MKYKVRHYVQKINPIQQDSEDWYSIYNSKKEAIEVFNNLCEGVKSYFNYKPGYQSINESKQDNGPVIVNTYSSFYNEEVEIWTISMWRIPIKSKKKDI